MGYRLDSKITNIMNDLDIDEQEAANILQIPRSDIFDSVDQNEFRTTPYLKLFNIF